jgi:tartrate dehydratase alpha subunit/fumarate hydratase class I-like protein
MNDRDIQKKLMETMQKLGMGGQGMGGGMGGF